MKKVISAFGLNLIPQHEHSRNNRQQSGQNKQKTKRPAPANLARSVANNRPRFEFDDRSRLSKAIYPDGATQKFDYDKRGNLLRRETANGEVFQFDHDSSNRLRRVKDKSCDFRSIDYFPDRIRYANSFCTTEILFGKASRIRQTTQKIENCAFITEYRYDSQERCTGLLPPGSKHWLCYEYGDAKQTVYIRAQNGITYLAVGQEEIKYANGVKEERRKDRQGKIVQMTVSAPDGRVLSKKKYVFNDHCQIQKINDRSFVYDSEGRIKRISENSGEATDFHYDQNGNRSAKDRNAQITRYFYDACNRLTKTEISGGRQIEYFYDPGGNCVAKRSGNHERTYRYDGEGRLVEVREDGKTTAGYAYDALGRRVRKTISGKTTILHYGCEGQLLAETDRQGKVKTTYLWHGQRCLGRIDGAVGDPAAQFYHNDHLGTVQIMTDVDGAVSWQQESDPFGESGAPIFMRKFHDQETGLYDFGARIYDAETGRFLTQDTYTHAPDDWRLLFGGKYDFWGERIPHHYAFDSAAYSPQLRNRYLFCLNDPVNNIDLDGHSAWWFILTIPSSLTWAMPNTVAGLYWTFLNLLMWPLIALIEIFTDVSKDHRFWIDITASARLGVPWALIFGSFFVWRPFTLGNIILISKDDKETRDTMAGRFVVPNDPDVLLSAAEALYAHESQHVFQYAYLGPLFHSLPLPPLVRLITGLIEDGSLTDRDKWWERIDLGTVAEFPIAYSIGGLLWLLSAGHIKPDVLKNWVNPASWWRALLPNKWVDLIANAWDLNNWLPMTGVYQFDSLWFFDQENSWFERNAGAHSGDVYQTLVEVEKDEIYVGEFTRVIAAEAGAPAVAFTVSPQFTLPPPLGSATASLNAPPASHRINFAGQNVVNADGFYFQAANTGTFTVTGTGTASETVEIEVKDIEVDIKTEVFICETQTVRVNGDSRASYFIRFKSNNSGGNIPTDSRTYTVGVTAGTDKIEVIARYDGSAGVFATFGDGGLAANDYVLKEFDVSIKDPTITPAATEIFAGGIVEFTADHRPQGGNSTTNVPGSQFNVANMKFIAGKGPITSEVTETVTLDYGCKQYTFDIKVKPITATISRATVDGGGTAQISVNGGLAPYRYAVSVPNSTGPQVDANGRYTAGSENAQVTDTITITDRNGDGGRARVDVTVRPMTVSPAFPTVQINNSVTLVATSGVTPFTFEITNRESNGSTIDNNGRYRAGSTPGTDTVTITDSKGTRITVTIAVTA